MSDELKNLGELDNLDDVIAEDNRLKAEKFGDAPPRPSEEEFEVMRIEIEKIKAKAKSKSKK